MLCALQPEVGSTFRMVLWDIMHSADPGEGLRPEMRHYVGTPTWRTDRQQPAGTIGCLVES